MVCTFFIAFLHNSCNFQYLILSWSTLVLSPSYITSNNIACAEIVSDFEYTYIPPLSSPPLPLQAVCYLVIGGHGKPASILVLHVAFSLIIVDLRH